MKNNYKINLTKRAEKFIKKQDTNTQKRIIEAILKLPIYAGHVVGNKRPTTSLKSDKRPVVSMKDWLVVKDCHELTINPEEFELIQQLITSRRNTTTSKYNNIFSKLIKCEDCGYALRTSSANRRKRPDIIDNVGSFCNQYGTYAKKLAQCTGLKLENSTK